MEIGSLHRHAVEINVLMGLFGSTWDAGLKAIRTQHGGSLPVASSYSHIDLASLSSKLMKISVSLREKVAEIDILVRDVEATAVDLGANDFDREAPAKRPR